MRAVSEVVDGPVEDRTRGAVDKIMGESHEPMFTHLGSRGFTSVLGNAVPQTAARLHHLLENRRFAEARQLAGDITPLSDCMDTLCGGQYIAALKYALHRQGICGQTERKPVVPLKPSVIQELDRLLDAL